MNGIKRSSGILGMVSLVGAFSLAGTSVIAARLVSGKLGVFTIAAVSLFFGLVLLVPISGRKLLPSIKALRFHTLRDIFLQALFGMFLFRFFLLHGMERTSSLEAGILTGATPAITALLAWVLLREPITSRTLAGLAITILGGFLVHGAANTSAGLTPAHLTGNLLVLCAAASESAFNILSRFSVQSKKTAGESLGPLLQSVFVTAVAFLLCLIPALFERPAPLLAALGMREWFALLWLGFFVTALAYVCWYSGIKRCSAFTAAAFSGLMPLTSMILSVVLLKERAGLFQWLGGACVISGMFFIGTGDLRRKASSISVSADAPPEN